MEYCEGGDLYSYLEKRSFKLAESRVADIIHKLATAIFFLHSYGVVHRDIKPENILMTDGSDEADVKLLDFGLSKITGPFDTSSEPYGTVTYVAPEVLANQPYNKNVDLWSIGVLAYLLLTGVLPFDDDYEQEVVRKILYRPIDFEGKHWEGVSEEAKEFVMELLNRDPSERMTINKLLEHKWIQRSTKTLLPEIRRIIKDDVLSKFKIYTSTD
jgi:serine/threonine protein kinase